MDKINELNRNKQGITINSKEVCGPLSSKLFVIYCFNGKTINIDSNAKVCKDLANLVHNEESKQQNSPDFHTNIIDVNFESKHKSVSEINQSILIKLGWNIDQQEKSSLVEPYSFDCNKTSQDKYAEEANQTFGILQRKKGEKFSKDLIKFIINLIDTKKTSLKKISSAYSISSSSLRNIQKMSSDILSKPSLRNFEKPSIMQRDQMIFVIKKYYEEIESEFTSSDVQKNLFKYFLFFKINQRHNEKWFEFKF